MQQKLQNSASLFRDTPRIDSTLEQKAKQNEYPRLISILQQKKEKIQNGIEKMQIETRKVMEKREKKFAEHVEEMENQFKLKLQEERKERYVKKQDIIEKSRIFKQLFDEFKLKAEDLDARNIDLTEENIKLRISFESQKGKDEKWAMINMQYKNKNKKLKQIIKRIQIDFQKKEEELKLANENVKLLKKRLINFRENKKQIGEIKKEDKEKIKKQLKLEKEKFQSLKISYIDLLSERSELEFFLKQCIEDVKMNTATLRNQNKNEIVEFDAKEREKIMQLFLSKEKVLIALSKLFWKKTQ